MDQWVLVGGELLRLKTSVASGFWDFVQMFFAIGFLTMAVLQGIKDLTPVRRSFQSRLFRQWLTAKAHAAFEKRSESNPHGRPEPWEDLNGKDASREAEKELVNLSTGGDSRAFYDLEIEKLCGQLNAAASMVFDYPNRHRGALLCLGADADPADIDVLVSWARSRENRAAPLAEGPPADVVNARGRVAHHVQRNIDAFQISAGYRWKWVLQLVALGVAYVLSLAGLAMIQAGNPGVMMLASIPVGLVGGFIAPVLRDVLTVITQSKRA